MFLLHNNAFIVSLSFFFSSTSSVSIILLLSTIGGCFLLAVYK